MRSNTLRDTDKRLKLQVVIADQDAMHRDTLKNFLESKGHSVSVVDSLDELYSSMDKNWFHIVFIDAKLSPGEGLFALIKWMRETSPMSSLLVMSQMADVRDAVRAIRMGAFDYMVKPFTLEVLQGKLAHLEDHHARYGKCFNSLSGICGFMCSSSAMQDVYEGIEKCAQYHVPVLISGETGVGKELVAKAIHKLSMHAHNPMISVNCGAIPSELVESELFGYEPGSFTGAIKRKQGYFECAHNSSIFLDEIAEMPLVAQTKLLRVISEGDIQKVGGGRFKVKTRLICATNKNLAQMVDVGKFREDLLYRINTLSIHIPPLRERREDIIGLAMHFMHSFCKEHRFDYKEFSPEALVWLRRNDWYGNVRELKSVVERGVIYTPNRFIEIKDLDRSHIGGTEGTSMSTSAHLREVVKRYEMDYINSVLELHKGNITRSAKYMGLDKSNLIKKMHSYDIKVSRSVNNTPHE